MPVVSFDGEERGWEGVTLQGDIEELTDYISELDPALEVWVVGYGEREHSNVNGPAEGWGYLTVLPASYPDEITDPRKQDELQQGIDQFKRVRRYHIRTRYV